MKEKVMILNDTKIKHILYDELSKLYFALDETDNFIDEGQSSLLLANVVLQDYFDYLNGELK